jgi:hypothetical protein
MANITVKKNDGTTDVIYTAVVPSAGDKSPAVWRNNTVGTAASHRPEFRTVARANGTGTARRVDISGVYPYTVTGTDGKITVADKFTFVGSALVPSGMPDADVNEAVSQTLNLMASTLIKDSVKAGYAPG